MENPLKGVCDLTEIEKVAEDILRDRSEIVELDRRRNANREGIRALIKSRDRTCWMTMGPVMMKLPRDNAKAWLENDQRATDLEVNKLRSDLKVKVNKLRDLEFETPVQGLDLKPLSREEFAAVGQVLGRHA